MIHVLATIRVNPGRRAEFLQHFKRLVPHVRAETGCLAYEPTVDFNASHEAQELVGEDAIVVVESWSHIEALQAHFSAPHMLAFRQEAGHLIQNISLRILTPA